MDGFIIETSMFQLFFGYNIKAKIVIKENNNKRKIIYLRDKFYSFLKRVRSIILNRTLTTMYLEQTELVIIQVTDILKLAYNYNKTKISTKFNFQANTFY